MDDVRRGGYTGRVIVADDLTSVRSGIAFVEVPRVQLDRSYEGVLAVAPGFGLLLLWKN